MGQYYRPYLKEEKTGNITILNRTIDGEYTMAKLMEHSWWLNPFVNAVCNILYKNPHQIAWVGDYADDFPHKNLVWDTDGEEIKKVDFLLDNKYIVNHTKKLYLNCTSYKERNNNDGWIIHPLSLLTAIGNGQGGGDYRGVNSNSVGDWCMDVLSIEDTIPNGYTEEIYDFYED